MIEKVSDVIKSTGVEYVSQNYNIKGSNPATVSRKEKMTGKSTVMNELDTSFLLYLISRVSSYLRVGLANVLLYIAVDMYCYS
jgi:hypothetical protein